MYSKPFDTIGRAFEGELNKILETTTVNECFEIYSKVRKEVNTLVIRIDIAIKNLIEERHEED